MLDFYAAHFQLTGRCNLSCKFCGQTRGMLAAPEGDLAVAEWLRIARELQELACGKQVSVMLWGGEPLLYPEFDELATALHALGIRIGMVTNATLLGEHLAIIDECVSTVHISLDGWGAAHDAVRGEGVFAKVRENLRRWQSRRAELVFLTTVSDCNVAGIADLPYRLAELRPDLIVLQQLMYLRQEEIDAYRAQSRHLFGCDYPELQAWLREDDGAYIAELRRQAELIAARRDSYPVPVRFTPHAYPDAPDSAPCEASSHRLHIRHDGAVGFCTDYFGFSAGRVTESSLNEIVNSAAAQRFREAVEQGLLPTCDHCPWRRQREFGFQGKY